MTCSSGLTAAAEQKWHILIVYLDDGIVPLSLTLLRFATEGTVDGCIRQHIQDGVLKTIPILYCVCQMDQDIILAQPGRI